MRSVVRFVRLDLRSMRPNAKVLLIPVIMVAAPVLLLLGPYMVIAAMSAVAFVSGPSYLFGHDDRGHLDTLYTALGIRRRQVVAGRYATCLLLLIALTVAGVVLGRVAALTIGVAFDWTIAAAIAAGSIALNGVFLAAELPAYFGTGSGPIRMIAGVPPGIILTVGFLGWSVPDDRTALLSWLGDGNVGWLAVAAFAFAGALGAASTALSTRLYARRDL